MESSLGLINRLSPWLAATFFLGGKLPESGGRPEKQLGIVDKIKNCTINSNNQFDKVVGEDSGSISR